MKNFHEIAGFEWNFQLGSPTTHQRQLFQHAVTWYQRTFLDPTYKDLENGAKDLPLIVITITRSLVLISSLELVRVVQEARYGALPVVHCPFVINSGLNRSIVHFAHRSLIDLSFTGKSKGRGSGSQLFLFAFRVEVISDYLSLDRIRCHLVFVFCFHGTRLWATPFPQLRYELIVESLSLRGHSHLSWRISPCQVGVVSDFVSYSISTL